MLKKSSLSGAVLGGLLLALLVGVAGVRGVIASLPENTAARCHDGFNNDYADDSLTDQADPDCAPFWEVTSQLCKDGIDNDADGLTDDQDPECATFEGTAIQCTDGRDNDSDGAFDLDDLDCQIYREDNQGACEDVVDNDRDGQTDFADADCAPFVKLQDPSSAPPGGTGLFPINAGSATQLKAYMLSSDGTPSIIEAPEIFMSNYSNSKIVYNFPYPGAGHRESEYVRSGYWVGGAWGVGVPSGNYLTPILGKLSEPKHYHVEVSRVDESRDAANPWAARYCAALDDVDFCSTWYRNTVIGALNLGAPISTKSRLIPLNDELVWGFCSDEDGCEVVVGEKYRSIGTPGLTSSVMARVFMNPADLDAISGNGLERKVFVSSTVFPMGANMVAGDRARGTASNPRVETILRSGDCYFTDAEQPALTPPAGSASLRDDTFGFGLWNAYPGASNFSGLICTIDIWD